MTMTDRLRIGVIGVGVMGERHARALAETAQMSLVAVVDVDLDKAQRVAAALRVPAYAEYQRMLEDEDLDAVVIATADTDHRQPTVAALNEGLAVLLEKPVASTLSDAEAILDAAHRVGGKVMVGHTLRYDSRYQAVAQAARDGKFGDLIHIYARRNATTWSGQRIAGRTSVTVFQGVHDLDAIRWISGAEIIRVYGAVASKALSALGVADTVMAVLHLSNGAIALLEQSWAAPYGVPAMLDARLELVGTKGAANIDMTPQGLSLYVDGHYSQPDTIYSAPGYPILKDMYARFLAYVQGEGEAEATLEEGIVAVKAALAIDESARLGTPVDPHA